MSRTLVTGIGTLLTGDLAAPVAEPGDLLIVDGRIAELGTSAGPADVDQVIDAQGATVAPGLIDSHCHVVLGDYTPRQTAVGFLASYVHGGITSVISPGEIHLPGRPHDAAGVKALAVLAQRSWSEYRPGGMKVNGGSIVLEPVLTAADFTELAGLGVRFAKFGFGRYSDPADGLPQVRAAQDAGILVTCHSGGASIPGSKPITTDHLMLLAPDICGHINGGPTSLDSAGLRTIVAETSMALQLVQAGNLRSSIELVDLVREHGAEGRVVLGSDTPTGTGTMPLGVLKTVAELSSLAGVDPAVAWAWATGNVSAVYGIEAGVIAPGRPADLVVMDAPWGAQAPDALSALARGDIPGISLVLIDGEIKALTSRNTPAAARKARITPEVPEPPGSAHVC
ncbi:amidohydrolase family protein [Actinocorallia sp. A-T 12471]|uniref:amidohydrolase family protein n=1 Tax=Actinocorallia sp. A-T 12471 TaxID=3089813 RepID=UPI0029D151A8|nr:amidohydrolase family protein [Actinocorallia sp. A-T 12471]MDX6739624.1 amidohydrolase family protein [Actinocorallia sp. A-T 12471]